MATRPAPLAAPYGDSWLSTVWAVAVNGETFVPANWVITAEAKEYPDGPATFTWTVEGGGILVGGATVTLSTGAVLDTGTIQLQMSPADWVGKPTQFDGRLDVRIASDTSAAPTYRYTVVRNCPFRVEV